ncbi:uncharacterized protein PADG_07015 [Paracoccidioides brasiliensis Pb18]|uniref:C3H1-type domain-containing protein n=1 Tax=Paracoccidioides brasiliensis (strain Pb18) TaxID=502780 RepID=C1GIC9_PARBD|nr:uncharacterized protein PADG_07015 [Paracoccidioides brasiliensis Pb18]EEH42195.2 hypothetical protein PADG_07015 [Paracoccidioides brasiliensis Pb18]
MPLTSIRKKAITCYYWNERTCKYSDNVCTYAHRHTGQIAKKPQFARSTASKSSQRDTQDLISIMGDDGIDNTVTTRAESSECRTLAEAVIKALQTKSDYHGIKTMLSSNTSECVQEALNQGIDGYSVIFEAVKRNDADIIQLLVDNGANPNATEYNSGIPLIAFAILQNAETVVVQTLLSLGANPHSIPQDFWDSTATKLSMKGEDLRAGNRNASPQTLWCSSFHLVSLLQRLDFGLSYHLQVASGPDVPAKEERQIFAALGMKSLLQAPYFLIGQSFAVKRVTEYVKSHLVLPSRGALMLAFVGTPCHGQAELAANRGVSSDDLSMNHLNEVKVVYFDDLDKTGGSNLTTLLDGRAQGTKQDTGNPSVLTNAKTICILSVTDCEKTILDFYKNYLRSNFKNNWRSARWGLLDKALRKDLIRTYGASLTSDIDAIIQFLPYSKLETAALAHRHVNDLRSRLASIHKTLGGALTSKTSSIFTRAVRLKLEGDEEAIYTHLAEKSYDMNLGARSTQQGIVNKIQLPIIELWTKKCAHDREGAEEGKRKGCQMRWVWWMGLVTFLSPLLRPLLLARL